MTLSNGEIGKVYKITKILLEDEELTDFLFTLGCYPGEFVTIVSIISNSYVITIKDGRYNIDKDLANEISVELYN